MKAYYNEIDPGAAQWLRQLIAAGQIAPGDVDERSVEDVRPTDLAGYTQCHFFAGIGVWSYALRRAGWPDKRPIWTGSCPCQPFSTAGQGAGFADERHLWPAFFHLIEQCRPAAVLGEQVAGADADPWIDLVCADMERLDYAFGATPFPSAGVGAPHIRERLYWCGLADSQREHRGCQVEASDHGQPQAERPTDRPGRCCGAPGGLADAHHGEQRCGRGPWCESPQGHESGPERGGRCSACRLADADGERWAGDAGPLGRVHQGSNGSQRNRGAAHGRPGPVNGFWRAADWIACRDGRWRPVEPGTFPLAHGAAARVGRLRAYGNAINAEAAVAFIECVMESA